MPAPKIPRVTAIERRALEQLKSSRDGDLIPRQIVSRFHPLYHPAVKREAFKLFARSAKQLEDSQGGGSFFQADLTAHHTAMVLLGLPESIDLIASHTFLPHEYELNLKRACRNVSPEQADDPRIVRATALLDAFDANRLPDGLARHLVQPLLSSRWRTVASDPVRLKALVADMNRFPKSADGMGVSSAFDVQTKKGGPLNDAVRFLFTEREHLGAFNLVPVLSRLGATRHPDAVALIAPLLADRLIHNNNSQTDAAIRALGRLHDAFAKSPPANPHVRALMVLWPYLRKENGRLTEPGVVLRIALMRGAKDPSLKPANARLFLQQVRANQRRLKGSD